MTPPDSEADVTERVRALRGATTLDRDDQAHLVDRTQELIHRLFERNEVGEDDLVSIVFTATADITCGFPAAAAREAGFVHTPLLCAQELEVDGAIQRCVRVLVHTYTDRSKADLRHVYLHEARQLRTDLPE